MDFFWTGFFFFMSHLPLETHQTTHATPIKDSMDFFLRTSMRKGWPIQSYLREIQPAYRAPTDLPYPWVRVGLVKADGYVPSKKARFALSFHFDAKKYLKKKKFESLLVIPLSDFQWKQNHASHFTFSIKVVVFWHSSPTRPRICHTILWSETQTQRPQLTVSDPAEYSSSMRWIDEQTDKNPQFRLLDIAPFT